MDKLQVLIVDDTIVYRKVLSLAAEQTGLACAADTAANGEIALEKLKAKKFQVVLLDVFMPVMDGLETLGKIRELYPEIAVIMISSQGDDYQGNTIKALAMGAMDFIEKPCESDPDKNIQLIRDLLTVLFRQIMERQAMRKNFHKETVNLSAKVIIKEKSKKQAFGRPDLVVITSSTGGPAALEELCAGLQNEFPVPVLIVQHMPAGYTKTLAHILNDKSKLWVEEGAEGSAVRSGRAFLAPGGIHMTVKTNDTGKHLIALENSLPVNGVRPAADVLFYSVAERYFGEKILAVVLTGMGNDGMQGIRRMKHDCDCYCLSQSAESCVVYGMPRSVEEAGLADEVVDLASMAKRINEIVSSGGES